MTRVQIPAGALNFREAGIKDLDKIYELNKKLAGYESKIDKHLTSEIIREEFMKLYSKKIATQKSVMYIAEDNEKPIAYAFAWIEQSTYIYNYEDKGMIAECFVLEEYRGKGIGEKLIEMLMQWFRKQDICWIRVESLADNPSREFWKKQGFREYSITFSRELE